MVPHRFLGGRVPTAAERFVFHSSVVAIINSTQRRRNSRVINCHCCSPVCRSTPVAPADSTCPIRRRGLGSATRYWPFAGPGYSPPLLHPKVRHLAR